MYHSKVVTTKIGTDQSNTRFIFERCYFLFYSYKPLRITSGTGDFSITAHHRSWMWITSGHSWTWITSGHSWTWITSGTGDFSLTAHGHSWTWLRLFKKWDLTAQTCIPWIPRQVEHRFTNVMAIWVLSSLKYLSTHFTIPNTAFLNHLQEVLHWRCCQCHICSERCFHHLRFCFQLVTFYTSM